MYRYNILYLLIDVFTPIYLGTYLIYWSSWWLKKYGHYESEPSHITWISDTQLWQHVMTNIMFIIPIIIIRKLTWLEHFGTYWKHGKNVLSWNSKSLWEAVVYYIVSKLVVWPMLFKTTSNVFQVWNNNFMFIWNEVHGVTTKWDVVFGFPLSMIQPFTIFCFKM